MPDHQNVEQTAVARETQYKLALRFALGLGFAVFAAAYLSISFLPLSGHTKYVILDPAYLTIPTAALAACYLAFRKAGAPERRFWLFLMLAILLMLIGEVYWTYCEIVLDLETPPYPSVADYSYLSAYVFFFLLLISMARLSNAFAVTRIRYLLDILVVMFFSFVMMSFFILRPLYAMYPEAPTAEKIITAAYPMMDLGIVVGILANVLGFKASRWRTWQVLVAVGLVFYGLADMSFQYLSLADTYKSGNGWSSLVDLSWLLGYFLFLTAALHRITEREVRTPTRGDRPVSQTTFRWPDVAVPMFVLVTIPFLSYLAQSRAKSPYDYWSLVVGQVLLAMLIVARSGAVIAENNQLLSSAVTDALTGLFNHRFFHERVAEGLERARHYNESLSVAILDVDNFNRINHVYGHSMGDKVLQEVGKKIKSVSRITDTVCRIGGDEFGVVLPGATPVEAFDVCFRIQSELVKTRIIEDAELRASVGIASFPLHAQQKDDLLKKADGALYWAKYHGKDQVLLFDAETVKTLNAEERAKRAEEETYLNTVHALAAAVDARDPYTQFHSRHVASLAVLVAKKLRLKKDKVNLIEIAAMLHDIGKIGIPDNILKKAGPLTKEEREQIQKHPEMSEKILSSTTLKEILPWILSHHERWDGKGYPQGLAGEDIPFEARILAVCDTYDAMTSDRPYRAALSREVAVAELAKGKGSQFDPAVVDTVLEVLGQVEETIPSARAA